MQRAAVCSALLNKQCLEKKKKNFKHLSKGFYTSVSTSIRWSHEFMLPLFKFTDIVWRWKKLRNREANITFFIYIISSCSYVLMKSSFLETNPTAFPDSRWRKEGAEHERSERKGSKQRDPPLQSGCSRIKFPLYALPTCTAAESRGIFCGLLFCYHVSRHNLRGK